MSGEGKATSRQRLGAHMSIAGGLDRAIDRARAVDATALQMFLGSARRWRTRPVDRAESERFRRRLRESGLAPHTLAHASYLINLAAPDRTIRERSVAALRRQLERCERLGIGYLVVHPGSNPDQRERGGLLRVARALDRALGAGGGAARVRVLLEVTAGQGSNLGHRFEHLAAIVDASRCPASLGVCFDTCHALAAGYEFRDRASYRRTFRALDRSVGLERLRAFHLNDSKHGLGSRRDRHEHIGRGAVGLEAFRLILNDPRFRGLPMVLETPKGPGLAEDRANLALLRELLPKARR